MSYSLAMKHKHSAYNDFKMDTKLYNGKDCS